MSTEAQISNHLIFATMRAIKERLEQDDYFNGVPIIPMEEDDIEDELQDALESNTGLVIRIKFMGAQIKNQNLQGPYWWPLTYLVSVGENKILNRSDTGLQKPSMEVAFRAAGQLHLYTPDNLGDFTISPQGIIKGNNADYDQWDFMVESHGSAVST